MSERMPAVKHDDEKRKPTMKRWILNRVGVVLLVFFGAITAGALLFYRFEHSGPGAYSLLDCFYWATQVATTTGPGDITPKTDAGKLLFMFYNLIVSVWLLLILGANIVVRAIKNTDIYSHDEQEWQFSVLERIYAMVAWLVYVNFQMARRAGINVYRLSGQYENGGMPPCPPQPNDYGEDEPDRQQSQYYSDR